MKKFKLLRFGQCYANRKGDFVIGLLKGDKKHGYQFAASHANPAVFLGVIQTMSRVIDNDGNWTEISPEMFNAASALHASGYTLQMTPTVVIQKTK